MSGSSREARGREDEAWRLEPEGEDARPEVPETRIVADGTNTFRAKQRPRNGPLTE